MLSDTIRILNFDNSLISQKNLIKRYNPDILDLKRIGPASRLWADRRTAHEIRSVLDKGKKNEITFLGSGDFHHISRFLIEQFDDPITIFIFDHHPDWDMLPPKSACGSWVTETLKNSNVRKVILCGISSDDISSLMIHSGNLRSLAEDRLEIYPYAHRPARNVFRHVPPNISLHVKRKWMRSDIFWNEIKNKNLKEFFLSVLSRLETKRAYVSIDKDCLKAEHALTNWEEGSFDLSELLLILGLIKENMDICGVDITGDYSVPETAGWVKTICSLIDHPKNYTAKGKPETYICSVNEQTNMKLLEVLKG
jgi:hypothetical protein